MNTMPNILEQWDIPANGGPHPQDFSRQSNVRYWWRCPQGHQYTMSITDRLRARGCPYCAGVKVLVGFNDLKSRQPELIAQWDAVRNGSLKPDQITEGSSQKVWWKCEKGHSWKAAPYIRAKGHGCPYCANKQVLTGFNDLETVFPELAAQWHPAKNGEKTPRDVIATTHDAAWWLCKKGHAWRATVASRTRGCGCPVCANKVALPGFNDLKTNNPALAAQWHPTKNGTLRPENVTPSSGAKVWWLCEKGHAWQSMVSTRSLGAGCPVCANRQVLKGVNDLASCYPALAEQWHPEKNKALRPDQVPFGSNRPVWWQCEYGHEWKSVIAARIRGAGCPYCTNRKVWPGFNDLATTHPLLAKEWDFDKNEGLTPQMVTYGSRKAVWWRCVEGHEWRSRIYSRASQGCGCPACLCEYRSRNKRKKTRGNDEYEFGSITARGAGD